MSHEDQPVGRNLGDYQDEAATQPDAPTKAAIPSPAEGYPDGMGGVDPFALWAATSGKPLTSPPVSGTSTPPVRRAKSDPRARPRPVQQDRRKFVKLLVVGTAGLVTVVTVGGISFARSPHSETQSPSRINDDRSDGSTSIDAHREMDDEGRGSRGRRPHKTPTPTKSPTPRPSPSPTQTQTPQPTMTPAPTGTVIGSTTQATNSAVSFTNPADGQGSLLVRMSNGSFTAFERACTHQGVPVNYDATAGQFHCPAHDAIFSATNGSHLSGPGSGPLPTVSIHVNANGTVTTP